MLIEERLNLIAHMIANGDKCIRWGEDTDLMIDAANVIAGMRETLETTLGNIRSLKAAGQCVTFDEWEKAVLEALSPNARDQAPQPAEEVRSLALRC